VVLPNVTTNSPVQLDDQLINGRTYTFQFQDQNFFTSSTSRLQQDLIDQAPDFLVNVQVLPISLGLTSSYLNVQFTYEGDGSDVISDVANAIGSAFQNGSNDTFQFIAAYANAANSTPLVPPDQTVPSATSVATGIVSTAGDVANQLATSAGIVTKTATNAAFSAALPWLIGAVLIVVVVLPVVSKSGLVPRVSVV
jgi:hypothetical protein